MSLHADSKPLNVDPIKTIEVEPVDEGVRIKPKRQLTETQLAILQKGREKLAEKRKAAKEQKELEAAKEQKELEAAKETDQKELEAAKEPEQKELEAAKEPEQKELEAEQKKVVIDEETEEDYIVPLCTIT